MATLPAYESDLFGPRHVGAIHSRYQKSSSQSSCYLFSHHSDSLIQSPGSSSPQRWQPLQVQLFCSTLGPQSRGRVVVVVVVDVVVVVVIFVVIVVAFIVVVVV